MIDGVESEALLVLLDGYGVCASAGSACASGAMEPSHVLTAMGYSAEQALGALRLTLGHASTEADVDLALQAVPAAVAQLRGFSASERRGAGPNLVGRLAELRELWRNACAGGHVGRCGLLGRRCSHARAGP